ncbi:hypothetical protein [Chitinilyticum aquatile]|uniref:hypothetical protein n=1 Tax=Chitinilyticum aquatile TaxID=362520 RepID=UPI0004921346|nr:hypothetical protein [Chitinilyticum aquatile]
MNQTKITVKIYEPLLKSFDEQLNKLCIKRDAFLNNMIKQETPYLARELKGCRLSSNARRYISGSLKRLGTKQVNIVVDKETAEALNAVVDAENIVRDAFINRMIIFLRSADAFLGYFDLPKSIKSSEIGCGYDPMPVSPMQAMEAVFRDPFYYLRGAVEEMYGCGLYSLEMPEKFVGFACYLSDDKVPGTKDYNELQGLFESMVDALDFAEKEAFSGCFPCFAKVGGGEK